MSVSRRRGTNPLRIMIVLAGLLLAASVACAGSVAAPDANDGGLGSQLPAPPALDTDRFDLPGVMVQYDSEPTFFTRESFEPFGRVPPFTMMEDGTVVYLDEGQRYDEQRVMAVSISEDERDALVQQVLDLGFERLASHDEQCEDSGRGASACLADASYTVLRVRQCLLSAISSRSRDTKESSSSF